MKGGSKVTFLLGAGRSGTTLLYKLLSAHPDVAYLSNYHNRWPELSSTALLQRLLNLFPDVKRQSWFKKDGGAYFNEQRKWFQTMIPTPSEGESVYRACGLTIRPNVDERMVRCMNKKFERIRRLVGAKVLLTKRTANNRRIPALMNIFPAAKYIHLIRDGRAVAYSLPRVAWWDDHVLFWAGKSPRQMVMEGFDPLVLAARNWVEEMASLESGLALIEPEKVLEVNYKQLLQNPLVEIERMIEFMGAGSPLPGDFRELVKSLQLRPRSEPWIESWTDEEKQKVNQIQAATLHRWGCLDTVCTAHS